MRWLGAAAVLVLSVATPVLSQSAEQPLVFVTITGGVVAPETVSLKMLILNAGHEFKADTSARLEFVLPGPEGKVYEGAARGPRTVTVPVASPKWSRDHIEIVSLGEFVLDEHAPKDLLLRGGLADQPPVELGTLSRGDAVAGLRLVRAFPVAVSTQNKRRIVVAAACEFVDDRRFVVKLLYLNCGERLEPDYDAFLHFELAPTGEDLPKTSALGLWPSAAPTDSSTWGQSEVTVARFGPYQLPPNAPEFIYLRAGLYDRAGDGKRLPLAGPDDTDRALVGRLASREGATWFERANVSGTSPEGKP